MEIHAGGNRKGPMFEVVRLDIAANKTAVMSLDQYSVYFIQFGLNYDTESPRGK